VLPFRVTLALVMVAAPGAEAGVGEGDPAADASTVSLGTGVSVTPSEGVT